MLQFLIGDLGIRSSTLAVGLWVADLVKGVQSASRWCISKDILLPSGSA